MMLFGAMLEALGIALIFPLITLISNPETINSYQLLNWLYNFTGSSSNNEFLIWMIGTLLGVYLFKYIYLASLFYIQYKFIFNLQISLSTRLLNTYIKSPYSYHLQKNSAELLRTVNSDVLWIFSGVFVPISNLIIEIFVVSVILLVLLAIAPIPTILTFFILGGTSLAFYYFIRQRSTAFGRAQQSHNAELIKWVNQSLGGIKEIKVLGREDFFVQAYNDSNTGYSHSMRYVRTLNEMPRLMIEGLVMTGILFVVGAMLILQQNVQTLIPTLGLFAMAAVRLMPSMNRILMSLGLVRYNTASIEKVYKDLKELENIGSQSENQKTKKDSEKFIFKESIKLENVSFRYEGAKENALSDVSLKIPKGSSVAFVGSSGAGKTTIVDVVLGLLKPQSGKILVDGKNIRENLSAWQQSVGYIPQPVYLSDDSIKRNVAFGIENELIEEEKIWEALKAAQLEEFVKNLPNKLETNVGEHGVSLSGGQRQRIGIARSLYHNPQVLILDEATAALDNETEKEITKAIAALSGEKTIIAIAHRLTTVEDFDCLFFMKNGKIIDSAKYTDLLERNEEFQRMATPKQLQKKEIAIN